MTVLLLVWLDLTVETDRRPGDRGGFRTRPAVILTTTFRGAGVPAREHSFFGLSLWKRVCPMKLSCISYGVGENTRGIFYPFTQSIKALSQRWTRFK
jgi:hypothetical protein